MINVDGSPIKVGSVVIAEYHTPTDKIGIRVEQHTFPCGKTTFSYNGKWGAGSRTEYGETIRSVREILKFHPRHKIIKAI
jgi:hypothetical protein